ncbi:MAG: SOS response-associated peptidase [Pirellulales bacterium]
MCGRLTLKTPPAEWGQLLLPLVDELNLPTNFQPRYNIAPTQQLYALATCNSDSAIRIEHFRWGLVPVWAPDLAIGNSMINARHETLLEKRSFKGPLEKRRCLIIADGYYEWYRESSKAKRAYWITPSEGPLVLLAGLWEENRRAKGELVQSCAVITTSANAALTPIHDRMPVAMVGDAAKQWLDPKCSQQQAYDLLGQANDNFFRPLEVSNFVNNARHEGPECIVAAS